MKLDYETIALKRAEGKGPKEVAQYKKKLAKDIKLATKALKAWLVCKLSVNYVSCTKSVSEYLRDIFFDKRFLFFIDILLKKYN